MSVNFELEAKSRSDVGKGASRRLRHEGRVPAILYGGGKDPQSITLEHNDLYHHLEHEAFYSHILTVKVDGKVQKAILRDLQRHPNKPFVMHADFLRINESEKIRVHVPLHFVGEDVAPGVKEEGGLVSHELNDIEIECLPKDLPEFIEVDISAMAVGDALHVSDLKLPEGVVSTELLRGDEHDLGVVSIHARKVVVEEDEVAAPEGGEAEADADSKEDDS